ncbi:MAG: elongation factor P, partial [Nitrospinota bacterium]
PGKGGAIVRPKRKNLRTGRVIDRTFRSGESLGSPDIEQREMQLLFQDGEALTFMDTTTFEQIPLPRENLGDSVKWLKEEAVVQILFYRGAPISVELPNFAVLAIRRTEPGVRGDTASGGSKPAELETGAVVNVPLFLNEGDILKIDTRTGEYIERVKAS